VATLVAEAGVLPVSAGGIGPAHLLSFLGPESEPPMVAPLDHYKARADAYAVQCGQRIRAGRINAQLSQAELARACYASHAASVTHWEHGRSMPGVLRQLAIADALTLPISVLFGHEPAANVALEAILVDRGAPVGQGGNLELGLNLRAAAVAAHYVSVECQHDRHGRTCQRACPQCSAPCRCWCHLSQPGLTNLAIPPAPAPVEPQEPLAPPPAPAPAPSDRARLRAAEGLEVGEWGA
jgi:transcriptional regulator with XRE-family HTH domain